MFYEFNSIYNYAIILAAFFLVFLFIYTKKKINLAEIIMQRYNQFNPDTPVTFKLIFPDGSEAQNRKGKPHIVINVKKWSCLFRIALLGPGDGMAIDYVKQKIDENKESRLKEVIRQSYLRFPIAYLLNRWHMLRYLAWSRKQARYNAEYHYGLHPDFYLYYLGPTRAYSTGFWYEDTKNLEEAQKNKWEMILKKLRLTKLGLRICSTGSGFGYGEMLAAEKYGAIVDCYNTTRTQNKWLRKEIERRGLKGKVNIFDADHRDVKKKKGYYDRLMAIEHIEHAGDLFRRKTIEGFADCLKDDGIGVIQFLSWDLNTDVILFTHEYLYPAVTMPPMPKIMEDLAWSGCEIQDLICARRHYHYTLNAWTDNFIKNWDKIHAIDPKFYNESFRRKWLLYLSAGSYYLVVPDATARLYQITFTKGTTKTYPMNKEFLYDKSESTVAWVKSHPWTMDKENHWKIDKKK